MLSYVIETNLGVKYIAGVCNYIFFSLTLTLLTWTIWRALTNASKLRMGFNSAFKGLRLCYVSYPIVVCNITF